VSVAVFDARGRCVRRLVEGLLRAGPHGVSWDGRDGAGRAVPGGVYFARIAHGKHAASCRFAIVR
jgi:flagellar hook assembly protein FlgD